METLVAKSGQRVPGRRRRLALVHGARSAFDMSGLITLHDDVLRPHSPRSADPAATVANDMRRVMAQFGRSAACARRALDAGVEVEDLEPGCTADGDDAADSASASPGSRGSRIALNSTD